MTIRIVFFLLIATNLVGQDIADKFEKYQNSYHLEKVYVNHDKPFYLLGDTIWAQATFVDGRTHQFFNAAPVLHVDWMDSAGEIVDSYQLKIEQGLAAFDIPTNYNYKPGEYTLRAYTQYQRNFDQTYLFQKNIRIFSDSLEVNKKEDGAKEKFAAKFFPEGGEMITGLNNKVAVKVQNSLGDNLDYTGILIDSDGNEIKTFKSYNEGIGFFEFTPTKGKTYKASIRYAGTEKSFNLPKALDKGYMINLNGRDKDYIAINIASNTKQLLKGASLIGHVRGQLFLEQELGNEPEQLLKLPREQIPSGVIHFTVFDHKGRPVCQRLTFNKNPTEAVNVSVTLSKLDYQQRDKIAAEIKTTKTEKTVPSSLSVSVYNKDVIPAGTNDLSIVNYLLLQSDLKGRIDNISQYFESDDTKTNFLIDMLMLTHGWSRFTWQDVLKENHPTMEYATAEDLPIIGIVRKHNRDKPVKADVFLSILTDGGFGSTNFTTEDDGIFYFKGFEFRDTTDVLIQANIYDAKKRKKLKPGETKRTGNTNVDIEILELDKLEYNPSVTMKNELNAKVNPTDIAIEFSEIKKSDYLYHPEWSIELDEVTVKALRKTEKQVQVENLKNVSRDRGLIYHDSSQKIFMEDIPAGGMSFNSVFDILRGRAPGVQIKGYRFVKYAVIRNSTNIAGEIPAMIMLDGVELAPIEIDGITGYSDIPVSPENILAIDIIKGLSASSVYGERGAGGAISIITKNPGERGKGNTKKNIEGSTNLKIPGFYNAREFYTPNYDVKSISHQQPNLNTTLYWEPMIRIGKKSKNISFFAGDRAGSYVVRVEGITEDGLPFVHFEEFKIAEE